MRKKSGLRMSNLKDKHHYFNKIFIIQFRFVINSWRELCFSIFVGLAIAGFYLKYSVKSYDVSVLLSSAKFCGRLIEPLSLTVERFRSPGFYIENGFEICGVYDNQSAFEFTKKVKPVILRQSNIIELTYKAPSPLIAEDCMSLMIKKFLQIQNLQLDENNSLVRKKVEKKFFNIDSYSNRSSCELNFHSSPIFEEAKAVSNTFLKSDGSDINKARILLSGFLGGGLLGYLCVFLKRLHKILIRESKVINNDV